MEFSRSYMTWDDVTLTANGGCACVFLCFKIFSVLILNGINIS